MRIGSQTQGGQERFAQRIADLVVGKLRSRRVNKTVRQTHVNWDQMLKVIATAPNVEWRCFLAFIRLVGSGISHALELRWADVDFANRKITFRTRLGLQVCPMFIEVVPYLRELGVKAPMEKVFPSIPEEPRRVSSLISSMVKKSGVTPWTPLIASIRSTRYLELLQAFPEPLVRSWMGHANALATDQEWEQAVTEPTVLI